MTGPAPPAGAARRLLFGPLRCLLRAWRAHRPFALALLAGALLRLAAMLGFRPALWFYTDSYDYIRAAVTGHPDPIHPYGYSALLRVLWPLHSFAVVVAVQHLLGLATAVAVYALLRRHGVPGWVATAAVLPVLLDTHQVQLEHLLLSDTLFMALVVAAVVVLTWSDRLSWRRAAATALLLGAATLTRMAGLPLLLLAGLYLMMARAGWRPVATYVALAAGTLFSYAAWMHSTYGRYELTGADGIFLYSRVMAFADCTKIHPPADLAVLCDPRPPRDRPPSQQYIWAASPLDRLPGSPGERFTPLRNDPAGRFARRAILAQPVSYLRTAGIDTIRTFDWHRQAFPTTAVVTGYNYSLQPQPLSPDFLRRGPWQLTARYTAAGPADPRPVQPYAGWLIHYQHAAILPGPLLALALLLGLAGLLPTGHHASRRHIALLWSTAVTLILTPPLTAEFDHRYVLPAVPFTLAAAALATTRLHPIQRSSSWIRS